MPCCNRGLRAVRGQPDYATPIDLATMQYSRPGLPLDAGDPSRMVAAGVAFRRAPSAVPR
jgi:hypothetical protein